MKLYANIGVESKLFINFSLIYLSCANKILKLFDSLESKYNENYIIYKIQIIDLKLFYSR